MTCLEVPLKVHSQFPNHAACRGRPCHSSPAFPAAEPTLLGAGTCQVYPETPVETKAVFHVILRQPAHGSNLAWAKCERRNAKCNFITRSCAHCMGTLSAASGTKKCISKTINQMERFQKMASLGYSGVPRPAALWRAGGCSQGSAAAHPPGHGSGHLHPALAAQPGAPASQAHMHAYAGAQMHARTCTHRTHAHKCSRLHRMHISFPFA